MKTEKKQTFRGAVLFTVVCVMSLMIIFLTSTLVLATSAHSRAHKSYASSQAHYTARSAIDSVLAAITTDENFAKAVSSIANPGDGFDVNIDMEKAGIGKVDKARVQYHDKQYYYDSQTQAWVEKILISITADVTYSGETNTVTAYVLKNPPQGGGGGGGGGGFVSVGTAKMANHTNSFGGTYFGIGLNAGQRKYVGDYSDEGYGNVTLDNKLYLNIDTEGGKTEQFDAATGRYFRNSADCVVYTTQNDQVIEAPFVVNGSFQMQTHLTLVYPGKSCGVAIWGDFKLGRDVEIKNDILAAGTAGQEIKRFNEIPYLYVDGCLSGGGTGTACALGSPNIPMNFFLGSIDFGEQRARNIYGNVYCYDKDKTSYLGNTAESPTLYNWSNSLVNMTEMQAAGYTNKGSFYTKGSLQINGNKPVKIKGDLIVEGNLTLKENAHLDVDGVIVVKGKLKTEPGHEMLYSDIFVNDASGDKVTSNGALRMKADGSGPLIEKRTVYYVPVKNLSTLHQDWGGAVQVEGQYSFVSRDVLKANGIDVDAVDPDGDGKVDGDFIDAKGVDGPTIDSSLVKKVNWTWNENVVEKESFINTDTGAPATEEDMYEPATEVKYNGVLLKKTDEYNTVLFPKYAEKEIILGFKTIDDATPVEETKVLPTVEELEKNYNFEKKAVTSFDATITAQCNANPINGNDYGMDHAPNAGGHEFQITSNAKLTGNFQNDIRVKATSGKDIYIIIDGATQISNGAKLIYDDFGVANAGKLNILINGSLRMDGGASSIITTKYQELMKSDFEITTLTPGIYHDTSNPIASSPNINIYSRVSDPSEEEATKPSLQITNNGIITANIEAPYLNFLLYNASDYPEGKTIYYNGRNVQEGLNNKQVGVIGILNVGKVGEAQNDWLFLYVPKESSGDPDPIHDAGENNWYVTVGYDGF